MDFIPHQIHLTTTQIRKMGQGLGVNVKHSQMGADKGDIVVMLKPQNARKMLTSYRKTKGMRLSMTPDELDATMKHGSGFFQTLKKWTGVGKSAFVSGAKKVGKQVIKHGSVVAGTAIGAYLGNPMAGAVIGKALGEAGEATIDSVQPSKAGVKFSAKAGVKAGAKSVMRDAKKIAVEALDEQLDKMPPQYRHIGEKALAGAYPDSASAINDTITAMASRDAGYGLYGGRLKKGSPEAKAYMASLRARKSGGKVDIGKAFKDLGKKIKKGFTKDIAKPFMKDVGKPLEKELTSKKAMDIYKSIGQHAIEQGIPVATALASMAMGDPTGMSGAVVGNVASQYASKEYQKAVGSGLYGGMMRPRGRPRKIGGAGGTTSATLSAPFKQALRLNKGTYGLDLGNFGSDNAPVSSFHTNPRVRPSSDEMTLSPYQSITSPAMNPFVPTYSIQAGGTSCGYGGRGLF
jgi:hypothetical protein